MKGGGLRNCRRPCRGIGHSCFLIAPPHPTTIYTSLPPRTRAPLSVTPWPHVFNSSLLSSPPPTYLPSQLMAQRRWALLCGSSRHTENIVAVFFLFVFSVWRMNLCTNSSPSAARDPLELQDLVSIGDWTSRRRKKMCVEVGKSKIFRWARSIRFGCNQLKKQKLALKSYCIMNLIFLFSFFFSFGCCSIRLGKVPMFFVLFWFCLILRKTWVIRQPQSSS